jgi:hypothetical protein
MKMANITKFWSQFWRGHKVQKRYVAFFTVVPLLSLLAFIKVPCPICDGTGAISTTGMGQVKVIHVDATLNSVGTVEGCVNFVSYYYSVTLTLQNRDTQIDANGYVQMGLVDYKSGKLLSSQYVLVGVPANMQITTTFSTTFTVGVDAPITTQVTANILLNNAPCDACNGTGKVALNQWLLLNAMKQTYVKQQQVSVYPITAIAPIEAVSDEWVGPEGTITADEWYAQHPTTTAPSPTATAPNPTATEPTE